MNIKKIVSGIQPSGTLHLGNYLGAVKQWKNLVTNPEYKHLHDGNKILFFIADFHSLTTRLTIDNKANIQNTILEPLEDLTLRTLACLISCGVDPKICKIFLQSSVPYHTELQWILTCVTPGSWLNSMIQYKEKKIDTQGLYCYPILMAADVMLYKATHVPVGTDQIQHIELIGKISERINKVAKKEIFPRPEYLSSSYPRVMSLTNGKQKMSKSVGGVSSCIYLTDTNEQITNKIIKSKTDSLGTIKFNKEERPELSNLISIYSALQNISIKEVESKFEKSTTFDFKQELAKEICNEIQTISSEAQNLIKREKDYLLDVLREGQKSANEQALATIEEVKESLKLFILPH